MYVCTYIPLTVLSALYQEVYVHTYVRMYTPHTLYTHVGTIIMCLYWSIQGTLTAMWLVVPPLMAERDVRVGV